MIHEKRFVQPWRRLHTQMLMLSATEAINVKARVL
jgi:hypothetical protein